MTIHGLEEILAAHPVFKNFDKDTIHLLAGCARNERFDAGEMIYGENDPADKVYLIREGDVAIEIVAPERTPIIVETLHAGDVLGWSWMVPPYKHMSAACAVTDLRAVSLDATCMRSKCEQNPALGYQMFLQFVPHMVVRFRAMRMQLLDVYGTGKN